MNARYAHTNIVAQDWKRLADFYIHVFGCELVPPQRDIQGAWLEAATGLPSAHIQGVHLRLPGYGLDGPTLEIFQYRPEMTPTNKAINRPGLAHLAFAVDDVIAAHDAVLTAGGQAIGEIVTLQISGAGSVTFAYVTDPEGNIIELQRWNHK
jgi:catechol 2,3-dioxygenase-like lactoylglutathione lyase family enzyme